MEGLNVNFEELEHMELEEAKKEFVKEDFV